MSSCCALLNAIHRRSVGGAIEIVHLNGRMLVPAKEVKSSGTISTGGEVTKAVLKKPFHGEGVRQDAKSYSFEDTSPPSLREHQQVSPLMTSDFSADNFSREELMRPMWPPFSFTSS
jgi:hypothetical protein